MEKIMIETKPRWDLGKNGSRRLRKEGWVPAVMYGKGVEPYSLAVEYHYVNQLFHTPGGIHRLYHLKLDDQKVHQVLIRDYQLDPVRDELTHVDFLLVSETEKVQVKIPVETTGIATGVKNFGGTLVVLVRELLVECLPQDIPPSITLDVTNLNVHDHIKIKEIQLGDKVKVLADPELNMVHVETTRAAASKETAAVAEQPEAEK